MTVYGFCPILSGMAAPRPGRRTQAERTATTRAALLDATVDCLVELGFRGTTTTEVAHRAGVSLGALLHHFPTKADLLAAAVGDVLARRQAEFRKALADAEMGTDRLQTAIDVLWSLYRGPTFTAWLELWVAARTDPELARAVLVVEAEFERTAIEITRELFADDDVTPEYATSAMRFTLALMDGVALQGLVRSSLDTTPIDILRTLAATFAGQPLDIGRQRP